MSDWYRCDCGVLVNREATGRIRDVETRGGADVPISADGVLLHALTCERCDWYE